MDVPFNLTQLLYYFGIKICVLSIRQARPNEFSGGDVWFADDQFVMCVLNKIEIQRQTAVTAYLKSKPLLIFLLHDNIGLHLPSY